MASSLALILPRPCVCQAADINADWPQYGRDAGEERFSPLDQINTHNVSALGLAWYHQFDTDRGQEGTPIVSGSTLYTTTAWSKVFAFDARDGKELWSFDPHVPASTLASSCCDAVNRGVAVEGNRVFLGTLDGRLVALDARTGVPLWSQLTVDQSQPYTITGAPRIVKHLVIIGNAGADIGVRGYVSAYDAITGKLVWRFYTVPNPKGQADGAPSDAPLKSIADATWFGTTWRESGGGGTVWDSMAFDPIADLLYVGVGNGGPNNHYFRSEGKGDNLFLSSILALRPETGEYVWHYQTTPGESWDYTATQHIMLADLNIDGKPRKVLMQAPKNGFFYVLDRLSGKLISATPYTKLTWATGVDPVSGRPVEVAGARYIDDPFLMTPGMMGGHSWHPMAFDPRLGLVYIPVQELSQLLIRDKSFRLRPGQFNIGQDPTALKMPDSSSELAQIKASIHGELVAWDPVARKARWTVRHPSYLNGGVLATAGGIVWQGTAEGALEAYDARSGKRLWSFPTVNGIVAPPISYAIAGEQFIAVMVGYGGAGAIAGLGVPNRPRLPGRLLVFKLGGDATVEPYELPAIRPLIPLGVQSQGDIKKGESLFNQNCYMCHGPSATGIFTADLRRSPFAASEQAWEGVVLGGAFVDRGMVGFAQRMTAQDAEDIRAFVVHKSSLEPRN